MTRFASAVFGLLIGFVSQASLATNYSDWWADPSYGGSSMNISQQGNSLGLAWYFYDATGTPTWIFGGGELSGATANLTLLSATGVTLGTPASVTSAPIGTATITFTSDSAATFAFTYSGTSAYSGRSGQLTLSRYTLASLPIAGTYKYASKVVRSECTLPASNGTEYLFGTLVITATSGTITATNHVSTGNVCNSTATYVQNGSKISTDGSYTCTNGAYGNGHSHYAFTDDSLQMAGTDQQTAGGGTCQRTIWRGGVRQ